MNTIRTIALSLLLNAFAIGAVWAQEDLERYSGAELFERFCASCHGVTGRGDGPVAGTLAEPPPDLTAITRNYGAFPAAELREIIDGRFLVTAHGPRTMPVWGHQFWVEEGADVRAEATARTLIDRLVQFLANIQDTQDPRFPALDD